MEVFVGYSKKREEDGALLLSSSLQVIIKYGVLLNRGKQKGKLYHLLPHYHWSSQGLVHSQGHQK